jgi:ABC-type sugar transport system permease subunit
VTEVISSAPPDVAPAEIPASTRGAGDMSAPGGGRRRRHRSTREDVLTTAAFTAPNLILFALFILIPGIVALALSFFTWNLTGAPQWAGLENYTRMLVDPQMWAALSRTVYFLILGVIPTIVIGFVLAALVNVQLPAVGALRVLFFIPMVVSVAVSAVLWTRVYARDSGLLNGFLGLFGIPPVDWLNNPTTALPAVTLILVWLSLPLVIILYLAALQRIPRELYEAAALDGAGPVRTLWQITWPNVRGTTALLLVIQFVTFLSGTFEVTLIMTDGGPLRSTENLALYIYKMAFERFDLGYASALTLFQFVLIIAVAGGIRALSNGPRARSTR